MKIKYDKQADALYIELGRDQVKKTVKKSGDVLIDFDQKGKVLGIEVLNYSKGDTRKERLQILSGGRKIPIPA